MTDNCVTSLAADLTPQAYLGEMVRNWKQVGGEVYTANAKEEDIQREIVGKVVDFSRDDTGVIYKV